MSEKIDASKTLPSGWSMIDTGDGYVIRDEYDEFVCEAETTEKLNELLNDELESAQLYASMICVLKASLCPKK